MRSGRRRAAATAVTLLVGAACSGGDEARSSVVEVVDGDTLDVRLDDGGTERVRIIGINSPERGECFAEEATARLVALVADGDVVLVADRSERDRFGRLLRYLEVDGRDVGEQLVRGGAAIVRVSEPDTAREQALRAAQDAARADGAGLWAVDACGRPSEDAAGVRIASLRLDADGDDAANLDDEWVELANTGADPVELGGWGVRDESASHRFTFPGGVVLAPGARLRLRSGCGTDTETDLHWCVTGSAVWNNGGDTAFLLDPAGNVVDDHHEAGR